MKKIITAFILAFLAMGLVHSQFNTDSKMVGASSSMDFGLFSSKDGGSDIKTKTITYDLNPRFGYFVDNRFAAGMDMDISMSRTKVGENDPTSSNSYTVGCFSRYYAQSVGSVVPFGEVNAGLGRSVSKSTDFSGETVKYKHNIFYAGAGGGAAFFLADNFALEGMLLYDFTRYKNPDTDGKHATHGLLLKFGFTFFFNSLLQE
jgi:hypothetical protein